MSEPIVAYASDRSYAIVKFTIDSLHNSLSLTGKIDVHTTDNATKKITWTTTRNSDTSITYSGKYMFNPEIRQVIYMDITNCADAFRFNGYPVCSDSLKRVQLTPDNVKPTVTDIKQKDQTLYNTWATIKELTITGTENLSNVVKISIKDPATGDVIVDNAEASVKDKKYTYKCTPELEGPVEGRKYTLIVDDNLGNKIEKDFMIYKTDCRAPIIRSSKDFTKWPKTKNVVLELTDYGSGAPQTSLIDQVSYKKTVKDGDKYKAVYKFAEDMYEAKEYNIYLKDGLGNARKDTIKVGFIDNTKPTVTDIKGDVVEVNNDATTSTETSESTNGNKKGALVTVTANDLNTRLNAEGAGVTGYAVTTELEKPESDKWQEDNKLTITEKGKYYLWVKDGAGNIADIAVITVKDDFTIEVANDRIVYKDDNKDNNNDNNALNGNEDNNTTAKDNDKMDSTPKTADTTSFAIVGVLLLASVLVMVVVLRRKKKASF